MAENEQFQKLRTPISPNSPPKSNGKNEKKKHLLATERAKVLLACYPHVNPHDSERYVVVIAGILARYSDQLMIEATDPVEGMQASERHMKYPPSAGEVKSYCDALLDSPRYRARPAGLEGLKEKFAGKTYQGKPYQHWTFDAGPRFGRRPLTETEFQQLLDREAWETAQHARDTDPTRPSYEQLKEKYGPSFGIGRPAETPEQTNARWAGQVQSWDEIRAHYEANPERWQALTRPREEGMR